MKKEKDLEEIKNIVRENLIKYGYNEEQINKTVNSIIGIIHPGVALCKVKLTNGKEELGEMYLT